MRRAMSEARTRLALLAACTGLGALAPGAAAETGFIAALERAPAAVVAEVLDTRQIDAHGYRGSLGVESALVGDVAPGAVLLVAWEELSPSRPPRFSVGDRVLVALERLSGASIWLTRIPDRGERLQMLGIPARGDAFVRNPSSGSVTLLSHYLALSPEPRAGPTGVDSLAQLAARSEAPLALAAVERLQSVPKLNESIGSGSANALVTALLRTDTSAAAIDGLLDMIASRKLDALRAPLLAQAETSEPTPSLVLTALASLDGSLPPEQGRQLLDPGAPVEHRRVAARWAGGPDAPELLASAAVHDPDPGVRSRAVTRLVELQGEAAASKAVVGLYDSDPSVRASTAASLGRLGAAAVPELQTAVEAGVTTAAQAAIAGLHLTASTEGLQALAEIAETHPDPAIRSLARFALGEDLGEKH